MIKIRVKPAKLGDSQHPHQSFQSILPRNSEGAPELRSISLNYESLIYLCFFVALFLLLLLCTHVVNF